jgi:PIN domain-containing protein
MNISEVVDSVLQSPNPTLLIDTCSILDIARLARSNGPDSLESELKAIDQIIQKASDKEIWILLADEVKKELERNKASVFEETKRWAQSLQEDLKKICRLHGNISNIALTDEQLTDVSVGLETRISNMTEGALTIGEDQDCFILGSKRNNNRIAPGSMGKEHGDCIIYEHYLACARLLRQKQFDRKIIYLSSNTRDYCESKTTTLKAEIASEMESFQMGFVTKWQWCLSQILKA